MEETLEDLATTEKEHAAIVKSRASSSEPVEVRECSTGQKQRNSREKPREYSLAPFCFCEQGSMAIREDQLCWVSTAALEERTETSQTSQENRLISKLPFLLIEISIRIVVAFDQLSHSPFDHLSIHVFFRRNLKNQLSETEQH